jgi:hypothetical protein
MLWRLDVQRKLAPGLQAMTRPLKILQRNKTLEGVFDVTLGADNLAARCLMQRLRLVCRWSGVRGENCHDTIGSFGGVCFLCARVACSGAGSRHAGLGADVRE